MIGERLAEIRKDNGMSQRELADMLGLSLSAVSAYERGINSPDDSTKVKIAQKFNVSLDYLLGAVDNERALVCENSIELPIGFPESYIPLVEDFISMLAEHNKREKAK